MQEIADAADLAVGTLYNYFRRKPDLLGAIVQRETEDLVAAGESVLERHRHEPLEAAAELVACYAAPLGAYPRELWRELLCATLSGPGSLAARVFYSDLRLIGQIDAFLEGLARCGEIGGDVDVGRLAVVLYGIYFTWMNIYLVDESLELESVRNEVRAGVRAVLGPILLLARVRAEASQEPR